jgi:hypothetical protein
MAIEPVEEVRYLMSSDDTLNPKARFQEEVYDEGYTADDNVLDSDGDYDSSSDSDGGLVMSRRKSATKAPRVSTSSRTERRGTGLSVRSKKSSRSGSSNTMKKVRTRDSEDGRQRPSDPDIAESS